MFTRTIPKFDGVKSMTSLLYPYQRSSIERIHSHLHSRLPFVRMARTDNADDTAFCVKWK